MNRRDVIRKVICKVIRNVSGKVFSPFWAIIIFMLTFLGSMGAVAQSHQARAARESGVKIYDEGSGFFNGYACLRDGDRYFYIDSTGAVAFDSILNGYLTDMRRGLMDDPAEKTAGGANEGAVKAARLPDQVLLISKNGKKGVLSLEGKMLLAPKYDKIDLRMRKYWKATQNGKQSLYTATEGFILPFEFNEVWDMDGSYFNVVKAGKWGVYNRITKKLVVPCIYEDMDYCYGCAEKGDYVFAKKDGKWGIINFQGEELLPFAYDHEHSMMRSDEWVFCLQKDGVPLSINLKTGENRPVPSKTAKTDQREDMADGFVRQEKKEGWGMLNSAGKLIYDYVYDFIRYDADEPDGYYLPAPYVALRKNNLCGVGDTAGHIIIPTVHKEWIYNLDSFFVGRKDSLELLYDLRGRQIIPEGFNNIGRKSLKISRDSTVGHILMLRRGKKYGFYNGATGAYIPPKYDKIDVGYQNSWADTALVAVHLNGPDGQYKMGLVDVKTGREVLAPIYSGFESYNTQPGKIAVRKDSLYGIFDTRLDSFIIAVESKYFSLMAGANAVRVEIGAHFGLRDLHTGAELCAPIYDYIQPINQTLYMLVRHSTPGSNQYAIYNTENQQITQLPYKKIADGRARDRLLVLDDNKARLFDPVKNQIIQGPYSENGFPESIGVFKNGLAFFVRDGKYGFMDTNGQLIQPAIYDKVSTFKDGIAIVMQQVDNNHLRMTNYKYGLIDSSGKKLLPLDYDFVLNTDLSSYFNQKSFINLFRLKEQSSVAKEGTDYIVGRPEAGKNRQGKPVVANYDSYPQLYDKGLATTHGSVILPPAYDEIYLNNIAPYILVNKNDLYGITDINGKTIIPVHYADILLDQGLSNYIYSPNVAFSFPILLKSAGAGKRLHKGDQKRRGGRAGQTEQGEQGRQKPVPPKQANQGQDAVQLWQYLDAAGKPLKVNDIRVRAPMLEFRHIIRGLFN